LLEHPASGCIPRKGDRRPTESAQRMRPLALLFPQRLMIQSRYMAVRDQSQKCSGEQRTKAEQPYQWNQASGMGQRFDYRSLNAGYLHVSLRLDARLRTGSIASRSSCMSSWDSVLSETFPSDSGSTAGTFAGFELAIATASAFG